MLSGDFAVAGLGGAWEGREDVVLSGQRWGFAAFWEGCCQQDNVPVVDDNGSSYTDIRRKKKLNKTVRTKPSNSPVGPLVPPV